MQVCDLAWLSLPHCLLPHSMSRKAHNLKKTSWQRQGDTFNGACPCPHRIERERGRKRDETSSERARQKEGVCTCLREKKREQRPEMLIHSQVQCRLVATSAALPARKFNAMIQDTTWQQLQCQGQNLATSREYLLRGLSLPPPLPPLPFPEFGRTSKRFPLVARNRTKLSFLFSSGLTTHPHTLAKWQECGGGGMRARI